ncbi:MAG: response regulator [Desulfobacterales bacterium]|nr:response regulator [Desulfobacterales bacterium]
MAKKLKFFIVDDDRIFLKMMSRFLEPVAESVALNSSSADALPDIIAQKPDCVLLDMMMPEFDGLEMIQRLRQHRELDATKIIVISGKTYEFDRHRALNFGADGYITKPVKSEAVVEQILRIVEDRVELRFWGIRGTLPVPGPRSIRYGGNTSCVSLEFPRGTLFVFDAGSGIKVLSDHLMAEKPHLAAAKIFISHPHWDHINALPFFVPLYLPGKEFEICGPAHGDITMRELISGQMDGVYFPIKIKEFSARVYFRDLKEEEIEIDGIRVRTMLLNHPGYCLGYRIAYKDRIVCYVTDNEIYPPDSEFYNPYYVNQLIDFVKGADVLITDCTYTADEYATKVNWGHSSVEQVADLAGRAEVKTLCLFHHDPGQSDDDIDGKLALARGVLKNRGASTQCLAPIEKQLFRI